MFNHPTGDYDFVVQLDPTVLPRYHQNIHPDLSLLSRKLGKYSNLQPEDADKATVVRPGYDPALALIRDLKVGILFVVEPAQLVTSMTTENIRRHIQNIL